MKFVINTEKKVRLASFQYSFSEWFIEGKNVKEVINKLMTDPTYLNNYVEAYPNCHFKIYEYEVGKMSHSCTQWNFIQQQQKEIEDDIKEYEKSFPGYSTAYNKIERSMPVYFNQKILVEAADVEELIKKHRSYKNSMKLVNEINKQRKLSAAEQAIQQEKIRKENDIFTLAKMMKNNKDFKKMLKEASTLESNLSPDLKLTMISPESLATYTQSLFTKNSGKTPSDIV